MGTAENLARYDNEKKIWAVSLAAAVAAKHEINIPEIQNNININNSNSNFIYLQD